MIVGMDEFRWLAYFLFRGGRVVDGKRGFWVGAAPELEFASFGARALGFGRRLVSIVGGASFGFGLMFVGFILVFVGFILQSGYPLSHQSLSFPSHTLARAC